MSNNILITGGTGFIGRKLCSILEVEGYKVFVFSRSPESVKKVCGESVSSVASFEDIDEDMHFEAIINLAGAPVADGRWSEARKDLLIKSRTETTRQIVDYVKRAKNKPKRLISGSAVGYYGDGGDNVIDEDSAFNDEFTHHLCQEWESEACKVIEHGAMLTILRIGLVVGKGGGFLEKMLLPFKMGLGGRLGDGRQWMPWIHMDDMCGLILFILKSDNMEGVFNATAPNPVTNAEFTKTLALVLKRPTLMPLPSFFLKLAFGEMSRLLLTGQRAVPAAALGKGYAFHFDRLEAALRAVLD